MAVIENISQDQSDAGFSVVELLVALSIMSIISLVIATATKSSLNLFTRGHTNTVSLSQVARSQLLLSEMIATALPPNVFSLAQFEAEEKTIRWTGGASPLTPQTGLYHYQLLIAPTQTQLLDPFPVFSLTLKWRSVFSPEVVGEIVLASDLPDISFNYITSDDGAPLALPMGIWMRDETSRETLFKGAYWPPLFVVLRFA